LRKLSHPKHLQSVSKRDGKRNPGEEPRGGTEARKNYGLGAYMRQLFRDSQASRKRAVSRIVGVSEPIGKAADAETSGGARRGLGRDAEKN